jgi:hypothetical protein
MINEDFFAIITTSLLDCVSVISSRNERVQQIGSLLRGNTITSIKGFHDLLLVSASSAADGISSSEMDVLQLKTSRYRELCNCKNDRGSDSFHVGDRSLTLDKEGGTYSDIPLDKKWDADYYSSRVDIYNSDDDGAEY